MSKTINCWRCGKELGGLILPMSRREECAYCGAEQHVCKLCVHYNPNISDCCDEDLAERVNDKERANFCDYFSPNPDAYEPGKPSERKQAEEELAALFGEKATDSSEVAKEPLDPVSRKEQALSDLEDLFGKGTGEK